MSSPTPKSPEQNDKTKKYDRQLRLWGDHGQKLLENGKVGLINATALGTEILKSLVLSGIGGFSIIDGEKVTEEDIGSNFFLDADCLGQSRAAVATKCLLELNSDVRGDCVDESVEHILSLTRDFFNNFSVVVATAVPEKVILILAKELWEANIPLVVCRSVGFLGYMRLQIREHTIVETHPDSTNPDLRLDCPWAALKEHLESVDVPSLDKKERSHVPALIILYYYLRKFRNSHEGSLPITRPEKEELKKLIKSTHAPEEPLEENFEEALKFVNTCVCKTIVPAQVQAILDDPSSANLTEHSTPFWVMVAALRELVQSEGTLPVPGVLPDLAADTRSYIALQKVYTQQAQTHVEAVHRRASQIALGFAHYADFVTEADVKVFCKHAAQLTVIRGTRIVNEYQSNSLDIGSYLEDPESLMFYYVVLRGLDRFISEFNCYPGQFSDQVEPDVLKLKTMIGKLMTEFGCGAHVIRDELVHEICRYGGAELHSVSSVLGGCAAQEVIKLITHQYKPLNNTFIYDAITTNSCTFNL